MDLEAMQKRAMDHMNSEHSGIVYAFCERFGSYENPTNVKMTAINEDGMEITCDQGTVFAPFLQKANQDGEGFRDDIIALYQSISSGAHKKLDKVEKGMQELVDGQKTVMIASVHTDGQCVSSVAPFVREGDDVYLCISSVAEHYHSIKANLNKISLLFVEDEKDCKTVFARNRLSIRCESEFVTDKDLRDKIFDKLIEKNPEENSLQHLRSLADFFILKATMKKGRYVKGFGAAYDTNGMKVNEAADDKNPHTKK